MSTSVLIKAAYDGEAEVWYVEESSLPGLSAESESLDGLLAKLPGMILDLTEEDSGAGDVPIELVAHSVAQRMRAVG